MITVKNEEPSAEFQKRLCKMMRTVEEQAQQAHRDIADVPMTDLMAKLAGVHDIGAGTPEEGAWPKRDAVPFVPEGLATVEPGSIEETLMLVAGHKALNEIMGHSLSFYALFVAYRAMHAAAPIELVSAGELAALRERDGLQREVADLHTRLAERDASALKAIRNRV